MLFRRVSPENFRQHLAADETFAEDLIRHCQAAGIPIRISAAQITGLLYPLVLTVINEGGLGQNTFSGSIDLLLELVAAYSLGEVESQFQPPSALPAAQG